MGQSAAEIGSRISTATKRAKRKTGGKESSGMLSQITPDALAGSGIERGFRFALRTIEVALRREDDAGATLCETLGVHLKPEATSRHGCAAGEQIGVNRRL
jgi:hypothetical protein